MRPTTDRQRATRLGHGDRSAAAHSVWRSDVAERRSVPPLTNVPFRHLHMVDGQQSAIDCWIWSVDEGTWDDHGCIGLLDEFERRPLGRHACAAHGVRYARHHAAQRLLLASVLRTKATVLRFGRGPFGKPYLQDFPQLHFNLSHSGPYGGLAVAGVPVGLDIEVPTTAAYAELAQRFFPFEASLVKAAHSPQAGRLRFARLWTAKEAYVKALGQGLTRSLSSFRVRVNAHGVALELLDSGDPELVARNCRFYALPPAATADYVGTLVGVVVPQWLP